ncbi:MAG: radical SAM protein [Methanobacteriota archaeon]
MALTVYEPGNNFPAVSVTGPECGLDCAHCSGKYLSGMSPTTDPETLWQFARRLAERGGTGLLVSGGCDVEGRVPLGPFLPVVERIGRELALKTNLHVGLCDHGFAKGLAAVKPGVVSVDVLGSDETVREVFGLDKRVDDYWKSYKILLGTGLRVVPHLTIGLRGGSDSGELAALARLNEYKTERLVLNILVPTKGTAFEDRAVDPVRALDIIGAARATLPDASVILGCMRPRGWVEFELAAMELGISGIVNPSRKSMEAWKKSGMNIGRRSVCCAVG